MASILQCLFEHCAHVLEFAGTLTFVVLIAFAVEEIIAKCERHAGPAFKALYRLLRAAALALVALDCLVVVWFAVLAVLHLVGLPFPLPWDGNGSPTGIFMA